jgi:bidirectional [NiFe] hydrogenase diaphorase subunit
MSSKNKIAVCSGKDCRKRGSKEVYCALEQTIEALGLEDKVALKKTDCMDLCGRGPLVRIKNPDKTFYGFVHVADVRELVWALVSGRPIERLKLKKKAG